MLPDDEVSLLVRRARDGDGRAFAALVDGYEKVLFNVALRMVGSYEDAKDLTQIVFLKVYENLDRFDPRHKFFSWTYRIMINECLNAIHRARRHEPLDVDLVSSDPTPEEVYGASEVDRALQGALLTLSIDYREVIVLRHFLQLTHREISRLLAIPEKTVKSRIHTARHLLGAELTRRGVAYA